MYMMESLCITAKQRACADVERTRAEIQSTTLPQYCVESNPGTQTWNTLNNKFSFI